MNARIMFNLVRIYELLGMDHDAAFERAFWEYKAVRDKGAAFVVRYDNAPSRFT